MYHSTNLQTPLQSIFWPKKHTLFKEFLLIAGAALLLAIVAQISVPFQPVPLTFESSTVILIGMAYGARRGSYAILLYLCAGFCGLPVFANFSAGVAALHGPTIGYLLGFLPAAFLSGLLAEKGWGKHFLSSLLAALLGVSVIFLFGLTMLSLLMGWQQAILVGLMPFIVSETVKTIAVAGMIPRCWKQLESDV